MFEVMHCYEVFQQYKKIELNNMLFLAKQGARC